MTTQRLDMSGTLRPCECFRPVWPRQLLALFRPTLPAACIATSRTGCPATPLGGADSLDQWTCAPAPTFGRAGAREPRALVGGGAPGCPRSAPPNGAWAPHPAPGVALWSSPAGQPAGSAAEGGFLLLACKRSRAAWHPPPTLRNARERARDPPSPAARATPRPRMPRRFRCFRVKVSGGMLRSNEAPYKLWVAQIREPMAVAMRGTQCG